MLPTFVLTSTNADDTFLKSLEDKLATLALPPSATVTASSAAASTTDSDTATGKIQIEYRPARDFYSTAGKHALSRVKVLDSDHDDSEPHELEEEIERMLDDRATRQAELGLEALLNNLSANPLTVRVASSLPAGDSSHTHNLKFPRQLGCAGALLEHMSAARARAGDLQGHAIELSGVELLRLSVFTPRTLPFKPQLTWLLQGQNHDHQFRRAYVRGGSDRKRSSAFRLT